MGEKHIPRPWGSLIRLFSLVFLLCVFVAVWSEICIEIQMVRARVG